MQPFRVSRIIFGIKDTSKSVQIQKSGCIVEQQGINEAS